MLYTGLREQELCHLAWDDLDLKKKVLRVRAKHDVGFTPKPREERGNELSERLVEALKTLPARRAGSSLP